MKGVIPTTASRRMSQISMVAQRFSKRSYQCLHVWKAELKDDKVIGIEKKPKVPKTNFTVTGLYNSNVFEIIKTLKPSGRGELDI